MKTFKITFLAVFMVYLFVINASGQTHVPSSKKPFYINTFYGVQQGSLPVNEFGLGKYWGVQLYYGKSGHPFSISYKNGKRKNKGIIDFELIDSGDDKQPSAITDFKEIGIHYNLFSTKYESKYQHVFQVGLTAKDVVLTRPIVESEWYGNTGVSWFPIIHTVYGVEKTKDRAYGVNLAYELYIHAHSSSPMQFTVEVNYDSSDYYYAGIRLGVCLGAIR